ncbi:hypothetical protein AADZ91_17685 [Colwelliaceae bacterium 6441]
MLNTEPKVIELNSISRANYSTHKLVPGIDNLRLIPTWRSYVAEYFFKAGLLLLGAIFIVFYLDEQIALQPLAIILISMSVISLFLKWLFKRKYAHIIFNKQQDKVYNTFTSVEAALSDIASVEIIDRHEWGSIGEDSNHSYRFYVLLLRAQSGDLQ